MAGKFSRLGSGSQQAGKAAVEPPKWHGRRTPPPPPGSDWDTVLDWAAEGGFENEDDVALALGVWTGRIQR